MHISWVVCLLWIGAACESASDTVTVGDPDIKPDVKIQDQTVPNPPTADDEESETGERTVEETEQKPDTEGIPAGGEPDGGPVGEETDAEIDSNVVPPKVNIDTFREVVELLQDTDSNDDTPHGADSGGGLGSGPGQLALDEHQRKRTGKTTKNYAATECGAKIEKHSPDVTSAKYVLTSNKDQYARAPCDKKFSFTVELCEKIQVIKKTVTAESLMGILYFSASTHSSQC
jgi:hypothetical protein